jgi:zinc transporter ZupT
LGIVWVALAGTGTALATGLGAVPVFLLGEHADRIRPALWGLAVGLMSVAAVVGLLRPALEQGSAVRVGTGLVIGGRSSSEADRPWRDTTFTSRACAEPTCVAPFSFSECCWCTACPRALR